MIKFLVTGQQLRIVTPIVVADTHNYQTAEAVFKGELWEQCSKWAHFIQDDNEYTIPFHDDAITSEQGFDLTAGTWQVYIHGDVYDADADTVTARITTSTALLKVEAAELEKPFPEVTPEFSEILASEVENALAIAKSVREDADSGALDGATFTPHVSTGGNLSWTNNKGLDNPETVNIKGEDGAAGKDFTVLGYFDTLDGLISAVPAPEAGDAYGVGAEHPYDIYIWDAIGEQWLNNGSIQGAKGDPGASATISVGTVKTVEPGNSAKVTNSGTSSDAIFDFEIPKGYTPIKGKDYWTTTDKKEIAGDITPTMIGAIANPESKTDGQYLTWDDSTKCWVASSVAAGVSTVNGQAGDVTTQMIFIEQVINPEAFILQTTPVFDEYPYIASKALEGVDETMFPYVEFSEADRTSRLFSPTADTYSGGVYIYAREKPEDSVIIPVILLIT